MITEGLGTCNLQSGRTMFEGEIERGRTSYVSSGKQHAGYRSELGQWGRVGLHGEFGVERRSSQTKQTPERCGVGRGRTSGVAQRIRVGSESWGM